MQNSYNLIGGTGSGTLCETVSGTLWAQCYKGRSAYPRNGKKL